MLSASDCWDMSERQLRWHCFKNRRYAWKFGSHREASEYAYTEYSEYGVWLDI